MSTQGMFIGKLGVDPLLLIFDLLDQNDVAAFRLVCNSLSILGRGHLVKDLHITFRGKSFQNLLSISWHPELSKLVRSITYEADMLKKSGPIADSNAIPPPYPLISPPYAPDYRGLNPIAQPRSGHVPRSRHVWEDGVGKDPFYRSAAKTWRRQYRPEASYTAQQLISATYARREEAAGVKRVASANIDFDVLASSFKNFPNLTSVKLFLGGYLSWDTPPVRDQGSHTLKAAFSHTMIMPHLYPPRKVWTPPNSLLHRPRWRGIESLPPPVARDLTRGVRQLKSILFSLISSRIKLEHLDIGSIDWSFFEGEEVPLQGGSAWRTIEDDRHPYFAAAPELFIPAFVHLKSIRISIQPREILNQPEYRLPGGRGFPRAVRLGQALSAAQGLVELSVSLGDRNELLENALGLTTWDTIAQQTKWPRLARFSLHTALCDGKYLLSFLARHAGTLQSLKLDNIYFTGGTLATFVLGLKKIMHRFVKLTEVTLIHYFLYGVEDNGTTKAHALNATDKIVQGSNETYGMKISQYLLANGKCPFDQAYWPSHSKINWPDKWGPNWPSTPLFPTSRI